MRYAKEFVKGFILWLGYHIILFPQIVRQRWTNVGR